MNDEYQIHKYDYIWRREKNKKKGNSGNMNNINNNLPLKFAV